MASLAGSVSDWLGGITRAGSDQPEFLYVILVLPVLLAATVIVQGIGKLLHRDQDGGLIFFLGVIFLGLIVGAYELVIR